MCGSEQIVDLVNDQKNCGTILSPYKSTNIPIILLVSRIATVLRVESGRSLRVRASLIVMMLADIQIPLKRATFPNHRMAAFSPSCLYRAFY